MEMNGKMKSQLGLHSSASQVNGSLGIPSPSDSDFSVVFSLNPKPYGLENIERDTSEERID